MASKEIKMGLHNRFDIEVVDAKSGEIKQKAQAFNVICDTLYSRILNCNSFLGAILYGSGSGTPSHSDTALFSYLGSKTASDYSYVNNKKDGIIARTMRIILSETEHVGDTLSEVGVSYQTGGTGLCTHAMLQDMNGNPLTIVKTATDVINIYATIYIHYDPTQGIFYMRPDTGSESSLSYGDWLLGKGGSGGYFAPLNSVLMYFPDTKYIGTTREVDSEHKFVKMKLTRFGVSDQNTKNADASGNIGLGNYYRYFMDTGYRHDFTIRKEVFGGFQITGESVAVGDGTTKKFHTAFNCPYNATVYINGQVASGVTVKKTWCKTVPTDTYIYRQQAVFERIEPNSTPQLLIPVHYSAYENYSAGAIYYNHLWEAGDGPIAWTGEVSNDLQTWESVSGNTTETIRRHKFFKLGPGWNPYTQANCDGYNIIFDTAPAQGDVITIDYKTDYIPKDSDHVLDFELTFTFGDWSGE